jgi:hypothetical protein
MTDLSNDSIIGSKKQPQDRQSARHLAPILAESANGNDDIVTEKKNPLLWRLLAVFTGTQMYIGQIAELKRSIAARDHTVRQLEQELDAERQKISLGEARRLRIARSIYPYIQRKSLKRRIAKMVSDSTAASKADRGSSESACEVTQRRSALDESRDGIERSIESCNDLVGQAEKRPMRRIDVHEHWNVTRLLVKQKMKALAC